MSETNPRSGDPGLRRICEFDRPPEQFVGEVDLEPIGCDPSPFDECVGRYVLRTAQLGVMCGIERSPVAARRQQHRGLTVDERANGTSGTDDECLTNDVVTEAEST